MANSNDLRNLGFRPVGNCSLDSNLKSGVRFNLTSYADKRALYSYVVGDVVKYIGVCSNSETTLRARMARYQGLMGAGTNRRVALSIREALSTGSSVEIFAWLPGEEIKVGNLTVDLVKGLENPLIEAFRPEWNVHG